MFINIRAERQAGRSIREQQDLAYQLSLQQDREKAEKMRLAEEKKRREEEEAEKAKDTAEIKRKVNLNLTKGKIGEKRIFKAKFNP